MLNHAWSKNNDFSNGSKSEPASMASASDSSCGSCVEPAAQSEVRECDSSAAIWDFWDYCTTVLDCRTVSQAHTLYVYTAGAMEQVQNKV